MSNSRVESLKTAIRETHGCESKYLESFLVKETFEGNVAWEGNVSLFALDEHPNAQYCYAWASPLKGSPKWRYYAVLKIPPVDSAGAAVRAAIVADHKAGR